MRARLPFRRRFCRDEGGSLLPVAAVILPFAIAAVGAALDVGRAYRERSRLQNGLDVAVISGLGTYRTSGSWVDATAAAQTTFSNYLSNAEAQKGSASRHDQPQLTLAYLDEPEQPPRIMATAKTTINSPFVQLLIGHHLTVSASSKAEIGQATKHDGKALSDTTDQAQPPSGTGQCVDMQRLTSVANQVRAEMMMDLHARALRTGQMPGRYEMERLQEEFVQRVLNVMPEAAGLTRGSGSGSRTSTTCGSSTDLASTNSNSSSTARAPAGVLRLTE